MGCRDPLTPNIDRNQAPETWITAAPFDTITIKDENGNPVSDPRLRRPGTIPVRFHVYWAGADRDGAVAGFYWAVVETLPRPAEGQFTTPNLPGPKPADYNYTTKTDSFFVFTVAEDIPDRQHAFFIYAVDNLGKPDATPARFIFNAQDRFPPIPRFDECKCIGTVYDLLPTGGVQGRADTTFITDVDTRVRAPRDTCPSGSALYFSWHGEPQIPQVQVIGYKYKLDEPRFNEVGPEVTSAAYNTGIGEDNTPPSTGTKIFVLRAIDDAFGSRDSTRRFQYNFSPDSWFSGPDINHPALSTKPNGERYLLMAGGVPPPGGLPGSLLGPDSVQVFPASRPERRTFIEIWKDTMFVREEGDTVHMNSWVLVHWGGYDKDSKYAVAVSDLGRELDDFPGGPVLDEGPANGSPVAGRSWLLMSLTPDGFPSTNSISNRYPVFDPNDVFNNPRIGGYHPVFQTGRAYMTAFAVDGDGDQDRRLITGTDPRNLVLRVEAGTASPAEYDLRPKVLSFEVNRAPYFLTGNPLFFPNPAAVDTMRSSLWDLRLPAADEDPFVRGAQVGGPSNTVTLRRRIRIDGFDPTGLPVVYNDPTSYLNQTNISLLVPDVLAAGPCTLTIELCDCTQCEDEAGSGRCRTLTIPVFYARPSPSQATQVDLSRPGSGEPVR